MASKVIRTGNCSWVELYWRDNCFIREEDTHYASCFSLYSISCATKFIPLACIAWYISVLSHAKGHRHNKLSSRLVAKYAKIVIKIHVHIYIILPAVLYGFEMYLMLREEQIEGFRNREVLAPEGGEVRACCKKNTELHNFTLHQIFGWKKHGWNGQSM